MTSPIKKRINTKLFINRTSALYKGESWNRDKTNEGDQKVGAPH